MDTKTYTENLYNISFNDETAIDIPEVTDKLYFTSLCAEIKITYVCINTYTTGLWP